MIAGTLAQVLPGTNESNGMICTECKLDTYVVAVVPQRILLIKEHRLLQIHQEEYHTLQLNPVQILDRLEID